MSVQESSEAEVEAQSVVYLDWNGKGNEICTGCYDGRVFIWNRRGDTRHQFAAHRGPVTCVKWSPNSATVLSSGVDGTVAAWDPQGGTLRRRYSFHTGPVLEVDWMDSKTFASCSADGSILLCSLSQNASPTRRYIGHKGEVNAIKWDFSRRMLASGGEDGTVKLWSSDSDQVLVEIGSHRREVTCLDWCSVGEDEEDSPQSILASASLDATVKVWDVEAKEVLHVLSRHLHPVIALEFSPNGDLLASGSHDRLHVWSTKDGSLVKTFKPEEASGLNSLAWDISGQKLAAGYSDGAIYVMDIREGK